MSAGDPPPRLGELVAGPGRWRNVEHHGEVDSTNAVLIARARAGAAPGLVVVADHQTAGRGRLGRAWVDHPSASLLVSCLVTLPPERPTLVPLAAGLAVADAVRAGGAQPELKWPNDVLIAGRKCAGVLVEVPSGLRVAVVGVGVDVDWLGEVRAGEEREWISLAEATGAAVDRWAVLPQLLEALDTHLSALERDPDALWRRYRSACATLGRAVRVATPRRTLEGTAADVDERGALVVATAEGPVRVEAGEVTHLRPG